MEQRLTRLDKPTCQHSTAQHLKGVTLTGVVFTYIRKHYINIRKTYTSMIPFGMQDVATTFVQFAQFSFANCETNQCDFLGHKSVFLACGSAKATGPHSSSNFNNNGQRYLESSAKEIEQSLPVWCVALKLPFLNVRISAKKNPLSALARRCVLIA